MPVVVQASSREQCYLTHRANPDGVAARMETCEVHFKVLSRGFSEGAGRADWLTWTYAETGNNPNNAAYADVAHEGQLCL